MLFYLITRSVEGSSAYYRDRVYHAVYRGVPRVCILFPPRCIQVHIDRTCLESAKELLAADSARYPGHSSARL